MGKRIVLLRSGRHLNTAARVVTERWPGCRLIVVTQPGTEALLEHLGVKQSDRYVYSATPRFSPFRVAFSRAGWRLRLRGFDEVAVLWNDPDGKAHSNVNHTALLLSPRGFHAILPDGSMVRQEASEILRHGVRRALASSFAFCGLQLFLCAPAAALRAWKR